MSEIVLEPCPFCKGEAKVIEHDKGYFAVCDNDACAVTVETDLCPTEVEAAALWNNQACIVEKVGAYITDALPPPTYTDDEMHQRAIMGDDTFNLSAEVLVAYRDEAGDVRYTIGFYDYDWDGENVMQEDGEYHHDPRWCERDAGYLDNVLGWMWIPEYE